MKCSPEGWCKPMAERLAPEANARRKGLCVVLVLNMRTGRERVVGVAFKASAKDRGLMLNVCPWCKEEILWRDEQGSVDAADIAPEQAIAEGKAGR